MYPVDLWERDLRHNLRHYNRKYPEAEQHGEGPVYYNPSLLQRLYLHRPDPMILKALFTWGLDGAPAEGLSDDGSVAVRSRRLACGVAGDGHRATTLRRRCGPTRRADAR